MKIPVYLTYGELADTVEMAEVAIDYVHEINRKFPNDLAIKNQIDNYHTAYLILYEALKKQTKDAKK